MKHIRNRQGLLPAKRKPHIVNNLLTLLTIITLACSSNKTEPAKAEEEHHEEAPGNFVSLTEEQIKTASIELGKIELKNLKTAIRANGMLIVPNQNKAFVTGLIQRRGTYLTCAAGQLCT
jgi:hypothetical protein